WEAPTYRRIRCHVAHSGQCADAQAVVWQHFDPSHIGQPVDVEQTIGKCGAVLHQADEVGTACDESELGVLGVRRDGFRWIVGSRKPEGMHGSAPLGSRTKSPVLSRNDQRFAATERATSAALMPSNASP